MDSTPAPLPALPETAPIPEPAQPSPSRLSLGTKLCYGVGDVTVAIRQTSIVNFLLPFYTDVALLSPSIAGIALSVGRIWDGVNDPIVGYLSDKTSTRFGRRRPYLLGSCLPLGLAFFLLWTPPAGLSDWGIALFLALTYILMDTFFTFFATPYLALGAELSKDYHERTQIVTIRALFGGLGALVGGTAPLLIAHAFADRRTGFAVMGAVLGGIIVLAGLVAFLGSREDPPASDDRPISLRDFFSGLLTTLANQPFRVILLTFAIMALGGAMHRALVVYIFRYWFPIEQHIPWIIFTYVVFAMISLPLWTRLARVVGKNWAFQACILWSVTLLSLFLLLRPDMPMGLFFLFIAFAGLGAGGYVLPASIAADVVDYDELLTGKRREGAFFGLWTLTMKLVAALAIALVGFALDFIGYVPNQAQSASTLWGLRLLYGPITAFFFFLSFLAFLRFPLTREKHQEIQRKLQERKAAF